MATQTNDKVLVNIETERKKYPFHIDQWGLFEGDAFFTTPEYWDCECEDNYIHHKRQAGCDICGAEREEQPPARSNEVWDMLMKK